MSQTAERTQHLCAAGLHMMDPSWESCPYCEAQRKSNQQTRVDHSAAPAAAAAGDTDVVASTTGRSRTSTRQMGPVPATSSNPGKRSDAPRLVGFMVTYTWRPEGQHFPVFEGKNYIGAGNVSSETPHRECEICIKDDQDISSEHALILCRQGGFILFDQKSTNGTYLGDDMIPLQGTELPPTARIRTGDTKWIFMKVPDRGSVDANPSGTGVDSESGREASAESVQASRAE